MCPPPDCRPSVGAGSQRRVSLAKSVRERRSDRLELLLPPAAGRIFAERLKYAAGYCKWQSGLAATIH
ncbi:hypothetical protein Bca4012_103808 [Brassica carinata]